MTSGKPNLCLWARSVKGITVASAVSDQKHLFRERLDRIVQGHFETSRVYADQTSSVFGLIGCGEGQALRRVQNRTVWPWAYQLSFRRRLLVVVGRHENRTEPVTHADYPQEHG